MRKYLESSTLGFALFAAVGTLLFGYDTGIGITLIGQTSFLDYMKNPSHDMIGAISSVYTAGEALGTLFQMALGDRLGRIRFMKLLCVLVTIGTIVQTASVNMAMFVAGRAIAGFAVGGMVLTVPMYLSEISCPRTRGSTSGLSGCGLAFGLMMANWIGVACSYAPYGQLQWRLQVALQVPWGILLLIGLATFMPESPRYYVRHGRVEDAKAAFLRVRHGVDTSEAQHEFRLMRSQIEYELQQETSLYSAIFRRYRTRTLVAISVGLMSSLCGASVVGYFQVILYRSLGVAPRMRLILAGVHGTVSFFSALISTRYLLERWGRRKVLLWGIFASTIILLYLANMQLAFQDSDNDVGKGFAVLGIFLYGLVNAALLEGATMVYGPEVLPVGIRCKVMGFSGFSSFATSVGLTEAAPRAFATIRQNYYYVFIGCNVCFLVFGYFFYAETRHKTLEEVAVLFGDAIVEVSPSESRTELEEACERTASNKTGEGKVVEVSTIV